jgi:hypothetical protein
VPWRSGISLELIFPSSGVRVPPAQLNKPNMTDPITIEREELAQYIRNTADQAIEQTLRELGIKRSSVSPWMSQNQAAKLVGRVRLESAIKSGDVRYEKRNPGSKLGRVFVSKRDVQKLLNKPTL